VSAECWHANRFILRKPASLASDTGEATMTIHSNGCPVQFDCAPAPPPKPPPQRPRITHGIVCHRVPRLTRDGTSLICDVCSVIMPAEPEREAA